MKPTPPNSAPRAEEYLDYLKAAKNCGQPEAWKTDMLQAIRTLSEVQSQIQGKAVSDPVAERTLTIQAVERAVLSGSKNMRSEIENAIHHSHIPHYFYLFVLIIGAILNLNTYLRGQQLQTEVNRLSRSVRVQERSEVASKQAVLKLTRGGGQSPEQILQVLSETSMNIHIEPSAVTISGPTAALRFLRPQPKIH